MDYYAKLYEIGQIVAIVATDRLYTLSDSGSDFYNYARCRRVLSRETMDILRAARETIDQAEKTKSTSRCLALCAFREGADQWGESLWPLQQSPLDTKRKIMAASTSYVHIMNLLLNLGTHVQEILPPQKRVVQHQDNYEEQIDYIKLTLEHLSSTKIPLNGMDVTEEEVSALRAFLKDIEGANNSLKIYLSEALDGAVFLDKELEDIAVLLAELAENDCMVKCNRWVESDIEMELAKIFKIFSFSEEDFQLAIDVATEQFNGGDDFERAVSVGSSILECILDRRNKKRVF